MLRGQRLGQHPARYARRGDAGHEALTLLALRAGIAFRLQLIGSDGLRQPYFHAAAFNRECPAVADGIPVQLVVLVEESQLARGAVAQGESMVGGNGQEIVIAGIDAHAVGPVFQEPGFRLAITQHVQHLEADHHAVAMAVAVTGGEFAIDAAPYLVAFGTHGDVLGHVQAAIGAYFHRAVISKDAFLCQQWRSKQQQQQGGEQAAHRESSTLTAARSFSLAWKNSALAKPKLRATSRSGTRCTVSLKSRTAPL